MIRETAYKSKRQVVSLVEISLALGINLVVNNVRYPKFSIYIQ